MQIYIWTKQRPRLIKASLYSSFCILQLVKRYLSFLILILFFLILILNKKIHLLLKVDDQWRERMNLFLWCLNLKLLPIHFPKNTQKSTKNQNDFILILNLNKQSNLVIKKSSCWRLWRQNKVSLTFSWLGVFLELQSSWIATLEVRKIHKQNFC